MFLFPSNLPFGTVCQAGCTVTASVVNESNSKKENDISATGTAACSERMFMTAF